MNPEKLFRVVNDEERKFSPFYNPDIELLENMLFKKVSADQKNEFHEIFDDFVCEVQRTAFTVGYRTAVELIVRP